MKVRIVVVLASRGVRIKSALSLARKIRGGRRAIVPLATVVAGLCARPAPVLASGYDLDRTAPGTLAIELSTALALAAGAFMLPSPTACGWCNPPPFDQALHSPAAPVSRIAVAGWSHGFAFFLLPAGGLATLVVPPLAGSDPDRHAAENAAIFAETFAFNAAVTVAVKKAFARKRPAFYYQRSEFTEFKHTTLEPYLSFFSGDTSIAFVCASTASTLAFMRGYASAPYVTVAGAALALSAGLMRIGADVHWPSDVFTGAVVGTSIGIAIPLLLHPRSSRDEATASNSLQPLVSVGGNF